MVHTVDEPTAASSPVGRPERLTAIDIGSLKRLLASARSWRQTERDAKRDGHAKDRDDEVKALEKVLRLLADGPKGQDAASQPHGMNKNTDPEINRRGEG
jgi:hypothetical protein